MLIFSDDGFCRRRRSGRGRRDGKGHPRIPAGWPVFRSELAVSLKIEIALHVADRKKEADLWTDANHLGLEAADTVAWTAVAAELLVDIAYETNHDLLRQELRCTPVEVHIDAALILRISILEIVGESEHAGEFVAGLRIEIGVAAAGVDRAVSDAYIRQAIGLVSANRDVAGGVDHVVVDAGVPAQ